MIRRRAAEVLAHRDSAPSHAREFQPVQVSDKALDGRRLRLRLRPAVHGRVPAPSSLHRVAVYQEVVVLGARGTLQALGEATAPAAEVQEGPRRAIQHPPAAKVPNETLFLQHVLRGGLAAYALAARLAVGAELLKRQLEGGVSAEAGELLVQGELPGSRTLR